MVNTKRIILPAAVITLVLIGVWMILYHAFAQDPPIENVSEADVNCYLKVNHYIRKQLKSEPRDIFPKEIPENCLPEYRYEYSCDFDGRLYYTVYLGLTYDSCDDYAAEKESLFANRPPTETKRFGGKQYILYGLMGLEHYDSENLQYYTGYSASFIELDDGEYTIKYLVTSQYSNEHEQPEEAKKMLQALKNGNFPTENAFVE